MRAQFFFHFVNITYPTISLLLRSIYRQNLSPPLYLLYLIFSLFFFFLHIYTYTYITSIDVERRGSDEIGNLDIHFEQRVPDAYYRNMANVLNV